MAQYTAQNSSAVAIWLEDCGYLQKMSENVLELLMSGIYEDTGFLSIITQLSLGTLQR